MSLFHEKYSSTENHNALDFQYSVATVLLTRDPISFVLPDEFLLENNLPMQPGRNRTQILTLTVKLSTRKAFLLNIVLLISSDVS